MLAAAVLFVCYWRQSLTQPISSDGAANALQAWDILHGNLLLHGWLLSDVSFYTTELPQYMLIEAIRGLGPGVVNVAAAMTYTLLVLLAGLLAKGDAAAEKGGPASCWPRGSCWRHSSPPPRRCCRRPITPARRSRCSWSGW